MTVNTRLNELYPEHTSEHLREPAFLYHQSRYPTLKEAIDNLKENTAGRKNERKKCKRTVVIGRSTNFWPTSVWHD